MSEFDYAHFAKSKLGVVFNDQKLLETALTHRSWLNEHRKKRGLEHNERMEFLGDAVLELVTTRFLYLTHAEAEGILTNWRSALVRTESIGLAADKLQVWNVLHLSRGEKNANSRARLQILANTYEALVGAVYLDQGYDAASDFIHKSLLVTLDEILETGSWQDSKSQLQEVIQATVGVTPSYKVLDEVGPDHEKIFTVGVFVDGQQKGQGKGPSKQLAQQSAAEDALKTAQVKADS